MSRPIFFAILLIVVDVVACLVAFFAMKYFVSWLSKSVYAHAPVAQFIEKYWKTILGGFYIFYALGLGILLYLIAKGKLFASG